MALPSTKPIPAFTTVGNFFLACPPAKEKTVESQQVLCENQQAKIKTKRQ
jgi:hypothetical protein